MTPLLLLPPVVAFALLAAHFYRAEWHLAVAGTAVLVLLVFVRRPWAARTMQVALLLGALEWLRSAAFLVQERAAIGAPYLRLALILGGVALFTALAALSFRAARLRRRFGLDADGDRRDGVTPRSPPP